MSLSVATPALRRIRSLRLRVANAATGTTLRAIQKDGDPPGGALEQVRDKLREIGDKVKEAVDGKSKGARAAGRQVLAKERALGKAGADRHRDLTDAEQESTEEREMAVEQSGREDTEPAKQR